MAARHVVCFGNELHGNDGFGYRVYVDLCRMSWPETVAIFYAGIAGLNALRFLEDCRQAILVDALSVSAEVGSIHILAPDGLSVEQDCFNCHDHGIPYMLRALAVLCESPPEILIVGVAVDEVVPFSLGLSDKVEQAVPGLVRTIRDLFTE